MAVFIENRREIAEAYRERVALRAQELKARREKHRAGRTDRLKARAKALEATEKRVQKEHSDVYQALVSVRELEQERTRLESSKPRRIELEQMAEAATDAREKLAAIEADAMMGVISEEAAEHRREHLREELTDYREVRQQMAEAQDRMPTLRSELAAAKDALTAARRKALAGKVQELTEALSEALAIAAEIDAVENDLAAIGAMKAHRPNTAGMDAIKGEHLRAAIADLTERFG